MELIAPSFVDITLTSGLTHSHIQHTGKISDLIDSLAAGACAADFDQDNWIDLVFVTGAGQTRYYGKNVWWNKHNSIQIYRNQQGYFVAQEQTINNQLVSHACAVADFNLDGLPDIIIATQQQDLLYQNLGDFKFKLIESFSNLTSANWTSHISVADINLDGLPDIHLSHYLKYQKNQKNLEESAGFSEQHHREFQPQAYDGISNQVLLNQGNWQFEDISQQLGLDKISERTLAAIWLDLNQDGWPDLLEFNSADQAIRGFINQALNFKPLPTNFLPVVVNDSHYASVNQQLNDPYEILFISRNSGKANLALELNQASKKDLSWALNLNQYNNIYQSRWGHNFADLTNNGYSELVVTSGSLLPDPFTKQMGLGANNLCMQLSQSSSQAWQYKAIDCLPSYTDSSRSVIRLDVNNDGLQDLLITNNNNFPRLLLNTTSTYSRKLDPQPPVLLDQPSQLRQASPSTNHWISLSMADNSQISSLKVNGKNINNSQLSRQALYGQHDPRVHLGLANQSQITITTEVTKTEIAKNNNRKKLSKISYTETLAANQFYQWQNNQWLVTNSKAESFKASTSVSNAAIDSPPAILDLANFLRRNADKPIHYNQLEQLKQASLTTNQTELVNLVNSTSQPTLLPLYLYWLKTAGTDLKLAAANAIKQLELEQSTGYLLAFLKSSDRNTFCVTADIFAHWFSQEEAVVRSKSKALPLLFKQIQNNDHQIVSCAANALAEAEHHNASSVIIDAFTQVPKPSRSHLLNALGKIRQTEAIPLLTQRLANSDEIDEIQQAIIALTRLNVDVSEQINELTQQKNNWVFLSLALFHQARDNIVLEQQQVNFLLTHWLATFQLSFADMSNEQQQIRYLTAAHHHDLSIDSLYQLIVNPPSAELKIAALGLALAKPHLINQKHKKATLLHILELNLTSQQYLLVIQNWQAELLTISPSKLIAAQLQNFISWFALLSSQQQVELLANEQALNHLTLSATQLHNFLVHCFDQAKAVVKHKPASPDNVLSLCHLVAVSNLVSKNQANQLSTGFKLLAESQAQNLLALSHLPQRIKQTLAFQRLSALFMASPKITSDIKQQWALQQYKSDKFSASWLLQQISSGNSEVLTNLITVGDYAWLASAMDINKILVDKNITEDTREKLKSYQLQRGVQ
ncbi:FG-GAP repeat domain-containing protein [Catenovulum maritimum]|uniref:FG-GAP repeat domain-containing protein n=1 Tax=Catenovulum maritimum TaxID=1513271 RepID=UPI00155B1824|nr:VCBS repeat-containing protein [Catenovulum maritimum]